MKRNVSEKIINVIRVIGVFEKNKNMSLKQEIVSDAAIKAWPFSSDFNFNYKDG